MKSRLFNLAILSGTIASSLAMVHIPPVNAASVSSVQVQATTDGAAGHINNTRDNEESRHDGDKHTEDGQEKQKHNDDQDKQHGDEDHHDNDDDDDEEDDEDED